MNIIIDAYLKNVKKDELGFLYTPQPNHKIPFFYFAAFDLNDQLMQLYVRTGHFDEIKKQLLRNPSSLSKRNLLFLSQFLLDGFAIQHKRDQTIRPLSSYTQILKLIDSAVINSNTDPNFDPKTEESTENVIDLQKQDAITIDLILIYFMNRLDIIPEEGSNTEASEYIQAYCTLFNHYWKKAALDEVMDLFILEKSVKILNAHPDISPQALNEICQFYFKHENLSFSRLIDSAKEMVIQSLTQISKFTLSLSPDFESDWIEWFIRIQDRQVSDSLAELLKDGLSHQKGDRTRGNSK